jgi:hypothetical protein
LDEYFPGIPVIEVTPSFVFCTLFGRASFGSRLKRELLCYTCAQYKGPTSTDPLSFRYYNKHEVILGKPMHEWLRFSVAFWCVCRDGVALLRRKASLRSETVKFCTHFFRRRICRRFSR